jgi:16S rRNA (adenine1518-N6/adenine1519-N6)-dimethyltransferase
VLSRIVAAAEIGHGDRVVEIGPGRGSLTGLMIKRGAKVVAVELDPTLAASLPSRLGDPENLTVIEADARFVEPESLVEDREPFKVVGNLPYYAANPIVRIFLEASFKPQLMVVMVQEEVAKNMAAAPGSMGLLSVATQYYAAPKLVCTVPARAFRPPPKVNSAVVRLDIRQKPAVDVGDEGGFFRLVRAGFSAPRKQLRNSLAQGLTAPPPLVTQLCDRVSIDGSRRPATLTLDEWVCIFQAWEEEEIARPGLR